MGACHEKAAPHDPSSEKPRCQCISSACSQGVHDPAAAPASAERPSSRVSSERNSLGAASEETRSTTSSARLRSQFMRENKSRIRQSYDVESKVGEGTYGIVRKATHRGTSVMRAIKTISKKEMRNVKMFRQEIEIMKMMDHPNIIKLFETYEDVHSIYLVMDLCKGGELFDHIIEARRFTEYMAAIVVQQILRAVFYMHENQIAHRDLKPENFLFLSKAPIEENTLKLIDFGFASKFEPGKYLKTKAGTPFYLAPQVLAGKYDHLCDTWSVGAIMYVLLCGYPPFSGKNDKEVLEKVREGKVSYKQQDWVDISDDAKDLIGSLLKRSAKERFNAEQALNHTWVKNTAPHRKAITDLEGFLHGPMSDRMRAFRGKNRLKKAALQIIASQLCEEQLTSLREMFLALDANGDGCLTIDEMRDAAVRAGVGEIPHDFEELLDAADLDGSGRIDYTEFLASTLDQRNYLSKGVVECAFATFDASGKGRISRKELAKIMGVSIQDHAAIEELLREVDKDGDGMVNFDDFLAMMQHTPTGDNEVESFMINTLSGTSSSAQATRSLAGSFQHRKERTLQTEVVSAPSENFVVSTVHTAP